LKSPFGHYFQVEATDNDSISANGHEISDACMFKVVKANIPHLPDWLFKRPHLNHNSITKQYSGLAEIMPQKQQEKPKPLGSFPVDIQETLLLEDFLTAMTSIQGAYIRRNSKGQF
jgi:hypothetical protein